MKKLMILGASYSQLPLYEAARKLGAATVAASTPGDWPGFAVADESVYADITNPEAILKAVRKRESMALQPVVWMQACVHLDTPVRRWG